MANPYPANFEGLDGSQRLTGQVDFTDSGNQPGGTGYTPPTAREQIFGNNVSIANNAIGALTWDHTSGTALLDLTDPTVPVIVTAGIYALTLWCEPATALTTGGFYELTLDMNLSGDDAAITNLTSSEQTAAGRTVELTASMTWYMPAGGDIRVTIHSLDGAATRSFHLGNAALQRIT